MRCEETGRRVVGWAKSEEKITKTEKKKMSQHSQKNVAKQGSPQLDYGNNQTANINSKKVKIVED
jgi:hypothetical protein